MSPESRARVEARAAETIRGMLLRLGLRSTDFGYVAEPVRRGHPALHEDVTAGDEAAVRTHDEGAD